MRRLFHCPQYSHTVNSVSVCEIWCQCVVLMNFIRLKPSCVCWLQSALAACHHYICFSVVAYISCIKTKEQLIVYKTKHLNMFSAETLIVMQAMNYWFWLISWNVLWKQSVSLSQACNYSWLVWVHCKALLYNELHFVACSCFEAAMFTAFVTLVLILQTHTVINMQGQINWYAGSGGGPPWAAQIFFIFKSQ